MMPHVCFVEFKISTNFEIYYCHVGGNNLQGFFFFVFVPVGKK